MTTIMKTTCVIHNALRPKEAASKVVRSGGVKSCQTKSRMRHNDTTTTIFRSRFNGICAGCGGDAGGSGGSDTAESKREAGVSAEDVSEDSAKDGGGSWMGLAGTLTGKLQWGHSILSRALLSSMEMLRVHQSQTKWIATRSI